MRHHFSWLLLVIGASALIAGCPRDGPPLEITATVTLPDREVEIPITTPRQRLVYGQAEKIGFNAETGEENTDEFTSTVSIRYDETEDWQEMIVLEPTGDNAVYFEIDLNLIENPYFWLRFEAVHKDWLGITEWKVTQDILCSPASVFDEGEPDEWISVVEAPAPEIEINEGQTMKLEVIASGSGILQYQWRKNGIDQVGEIGNIFTKTNMKPSDAGQYTCVIRTDNKALGISMKQWQPFGAKPEGETFEGANNGEGQPAL